MQLKRSGENLRAGRVRLVEMMKFEIRTMSSQTRSSSYSRTRVSVVHGSRADSRRDLSSLFSTLVSLFSFDNRSNWTVGEVSTATCDLFSQPLRLSPKQLLVATGDWIDIRNIGIAFSALSLKLYSNKSIAFEYRLKPNIPSLIMHHRDQILA
jgi:hypothetical protein